MTRAGRVAVGLAVVVLVVLGLGTGIASAKDSNTPDGAEAAAKRFFGYINDRQWGTYYRYVHPAQQALVSKDEFTACLAKAIPKGLSLDNVDVTVATKSTETIPGTDTTAKVVDLTVKYTLKQGNAERGVSDRTILIWVKNRWTWAMSPGRIAECTATPATVPTTVPVG